MPRSLGIAALLFLLISPLPAREARAGGSLRDYALKGRGRFAFGVYVKNKKVGWEVEEFKLGKRDGKEVVVHSTHRYTVLKFMGERSETEEESVTEYELEGVGCIVFARVKEREDRKETLRTAVRKGNDIMLTTRTAGRTTERRVPIPKDTLAQQRRFEAWLQGPPKAGATFDTYSASWDEDDVDVKEVYTFKEKKSILWGGVRTEVYAVRNLSQGARVDAELRGDGRLLTGRLGGLLEMRLEKEAVARKLDGGEVDLLAASAIAVDKDLGEARRVDKLTLHVTGLGDYSLPTSHRQRVLPREGGVLVELARDHRVSGAVPLSADEKRDAVKATATIQADHDSVRRLARRVVGTQKDPVKAAGLLSKWVYKNLRKSYAANADDALTVLDNRAGDCTEHALLFVALARAAGIPARQVGGLAFVREPKPLFGWHAWAEVHDGTQWVSVDPTWNEVYVDATHIKFSEGSQDYGWINVAGKLKMKVVKVQARC